MLEAVPKKTFSNDFILRSTDQNVAELSVSSWRERAEFNIDGVPHRLYRDGLTGPFVLEKAGTVVVRAVKPSAFRCLFQLDLGGVSLTLRKLSMFSRRFGLFSGDQQVGEIRPAGHFTRRAILDLPSDWPVALQLFVFWLALMIWNREAAAASS
jgi:hypothetical protein